MKTSSKPHIVILHGWGASSRSFQEVGLLLKKEGFQVLIPDLPGFGDEPLLKDPMTFTDYVTYVESLIRGKRVILLGHSFGGRLSIAYAASRNNQVSKLILTGASGIPHPLSLKKQLGAGFAAVGINLFGDSRLGGLLRKLNYFWLGEMDYYTAGGKLKETFKNVYNVDIRSLLPKIVCPTLLVWGENDLIIPVSDGEYMGKHIKNAEVIVVKGASHKLPYQMPHVFVEKILPFLTKS